VWRYLNLGRPETVATTGISITGLYPITANFRFILSSRKSLMISNIYMFSEQAAMK
jgi:hypothetical protein